MNTPDYVKDKALSTGFIVGWFAGVTLFFLTFALSKNVTAALTAGMFFGIVFGWAVFNVTIKNYTKE